MNLKYPEPAIFRERLIGYSPEQVGKIVSDLKNALIKARVTFDELSKLGNGDMDGNSIGNTIAQEARAKIDRLFE